MAKSALEKWKEENRQNKPVASSGTNKLEQWKQENRQNKPVTVSAPSAAAAPVTRGPSATSVYGSANRTAPMGMETRNTLMAAATEIAARQAEEQRRKKQQEAFMSNPRASTAYTRQTEKAPVQDRARKVAEIRKDIDTTPVQGRVGKGLQSIGLSTPASIEYLGESAKQAYKNQQAYEESDLQQRIAEAYSNLNLTEQQYGWGSPEYEQARQNYDAVVAQLNAFKNAPDKAVDMDSRAAQFMGRVQKLQEEALEGTSGTGRFLGEAALSIGSNLAKLPANAIIPGASLALMGAEAAAGKAYELGQQGVNAGQALTRGLVSGGIEALTEKIPLDNLVDIIKTGGKTGLMNVLKQAVTEAGEEGVAYLLNFGADKVAGDPEAEFVWNDFIRSMGLGALSGGIMGGGATAINRANAAAVGKNYQDVAPELIEEGLQMNRDTDAYRTAAEMQRKLDAGKTLSNVDVGRVVQDNETAMAPLRQAAMEMAEEQVEREAQAEMPKRTVVQPIAMKPRTAYTETRQNTEGGVNGGEKVHLRESGQRDDRAYPGGEVPRMEESAGRDQSRQDSRLPAKDAGAADLRVGEEVSTASLGIGNGASNDRVRVVTGGDTEATAKARAIAKERGLRLTLFTGGNLTINGEECRAYITGDRAFVRADHSDFDADQLMRHEAGHDQIAKGEIDIKAATENIRKRLGGRNNVQRAAQTYASAFAGADMTVEEAIEEIICDSLGDMNVFSDTAVETAFGEVLESAKAAAGESRVESKTGPPVEGKASKEHWRTDLNKRQFQELMKAVKQDAKTSRNNITKNANWLFANVGDTPVFSIYSTLDQNEPTVLYEVKGEQAEFEKNALNDVLEAIKHGKSVDGKSNDVGAVLSRGWVRGSGGDINGSGGAGRRSDSGNAGVLRQQPQRHTSTAFESVLRNLFQVQETESVNENLAALGVESDDGSVGKASRETNREDVLKAVEKLLEEYGPIEPGENPFRSIQIPKKTSKTKNVSKTVRTILEAEATPDAMIPDVEALVAEGKLSYNPYSDAAAVSDAEKAIADIGWEKSLEKWKADNKEGVVSKAHTVMGWALYNNAANNKKTDVALDILQEMVGSQRNAAQALQATRVLKTLSPNAQLYGVQRSVANLQRELEKRYKDKAPKLKVNAELAEKFLNAKGDEAQAEAMRELYQDIGSQMPATVRDKWDAWRYLAMLGNTRTHIRNILGNAVFAPVVAAKNVTATAVEHIVQKASGENIQRTKSMVGGVAIYNVFNKDKPLYIGGKTTQALLKAAWDDYANIADLVSGGGKYSELKQSNKYVEEGRQIFKPKWLEKARKGNSAALEIEDIWFSQSHYTTALASYCKANNIPAQHIAKGGEQIDKARAYAIVEAQKATYKDINQLSESMGKIGRAARDSDNSVAKGFGLLMEGVLPFRKTPANILARAVEYSPIGLAKSLTVDIAKVRNAETEDKPMLAAKAVDNFAAGFVGTALVAAGWVLAKLGLVRGRGEDDEAERKFREMQGYQAYSMELGDGTSITLDWLAPEALPFFIGVNLYEALNEDKQEISTEMILKALSNIGAPMLEMSCLQSLNDVFEAGTYADSTAGLSVVVSAATSYFTSGIPTLGGQIERIFQNERMFTYTDKNDRWVPTDLQYTLGKASAKIPIPGLDYNQVPYIDAWGRTEKTPDRAENAFNNLINPAYVSKIGTSDMEEELLRLYRSDANERNSILPSSQKKKVGSGDSEVKFTAKQYVQYNTERGQTAYDLLTDLVDDNLYEKATDKQRIAAVEQAYDYASQVSRKHIQSEWDKMDNWIVRAMEADKVGLSESDVLLYRLALQMANEDGNNSYNQEEAQRAVEMLEGLTKQQKSYLWETTSKQWVGSKNNPYK